MSLRLLATRRAPLLAAAGLLALLWSGLAPGDRAGGSAETGAELDRAERELLLLIQGDPVAVEPSPALCAQYGRTPLGVPRGSQEWHFGAARCAVLYPPSATAIVTTATGGIAKRLYESPAVTAQLNEVLDRILELVAGEPLTPERKLMLHTTAWELGMGLRSSLDAHGEWEPPLRATICKSFELLRRTRFSEAEVARLPATLPALPGLAAAPDLAEVVAAIARRDPAVVEVYPSTDSHAEALFGRFSPRIFLTLADGSQRLRDFVAGGPGQDALLKLAHRFAGVGGVLVLYFNVVTESNTIVATEQVAIFQRYEFSGRTSYDLPFERAAALLEFSTVVFERDLGAQRAGAGPAAAAPEPRYRKLDPQSMALAGFVDAKPGVAGIPATTLRSNCLSCHLYRVETFNTHGGRSADFSAPFTHPSRDLVAGHITRVIGPRIQHEVESCGPAGTDARQAVGQ